MNRIFEISFFFSFGWIDDWAGRVELAFEFQVAVIYIMLYILVDIVVHPSHTSTIQ